MCSTIARPRIASFIKRATFILALLAVALASFGFGVKKLNGKIYFDEFTYCYYAGTFKGFVHRYWHDAVLHSDLKHQAVPVGMYWIALTIYFTKYNYMLQEPSHIWVPVYEPPPSDDTRRLTKDHPFPYVKEMVAALRERMLIYRALTCVLLFVLAWYAGGYGPALLAVALTLTSRRFYLESSLVQLETIWAFQHFFNILLIYFYFKMLHKENFNSSASALVALCIGFTAGLLAATKIHGALNIFIYAACFILFWQMKARVKLWGTRYTHTAILHSGIVILAALLAFIIINPTLYYNPIFGMKSITTNWLLLVQRQAQERPWDYLPGPLERLVYIARSSTCRWYEPVWMVAGFFFVCAQGKEWFRSGKKAGIHFIVLTAFFAVLLSLLLFMQVGQRRYIVVLMCYLYLFEGAGIWAVLGVAGRALHHLKK